MKNILLLSVFLALIVESNAQFVKRKLGPSLNDKSFNYKYPFISLDGSIIFFHYDYTDDFTMEPQVALRQGVDWKDPVPITKKLAALSFRKGFTFSPDGSMMYVTLKAAYSLGGFDILACKANGTSFSEPLTLGPPINSATNDASPTFSPDGNYMFFMRCNKMDFNSADECKILMSKKRNGVWETPTELPAFINKGNSQMPRIMGDGQTLIFSSNKHTPSKGGMDLYLTKMDGANWSEPINLDFVNTAADEVYACATSQGRTLILDVMGEKKSELMEFTFPEDIRPKAVTRIIGQLSGLPDPTKAYVTVINLETLQIASRTYAEKDGSFNCYLTEGAIYGVNIDPANDQFLYSLKQYDFRDGNKVPVFDRMNVKMQPVKSGDVIELSTVSFKPYSSEIEQTSIIEMQKISKMMRGNPNLKFNVDVKLYGYVKDSLQTEDLTEVIADSVVYTREIQIDSVTTATEDSIAVEYTYHNDRTQQQAKTLVDFMIQQRVNPANITFTNQAIAEAIPEKRRIVISLRVK